MNCKNNNLIKRLIAAVAVPVMLVVSLSSCGGETSRKIKIDALSEHLSEYTSHDYHTTSEKDLVFVARSGLIELYYDSVTCSVAIKETSANKNWYSIPLTSDGDDKAQTSVISLKVTKGNDVYYLNSQDNAVAFSSASFKPINNGIQITYDMALDSATAQGGYEAAGDSLYVSVSTTYSLADGAFSAKINCGDIIVSDGYTVENIDFMKYFGATTKADESDYIFVPDACGALVMTGQTQNDEYETRTYSVYGEDKSIKNYDDTATSGTSVSQADALLPAFGMKCGSSAFLGLILSGDTVAAIDSARYNGGGTYNRVGASFRITDSYITTNGEKHAKYSGEKYSGEINICYRFLSNKNAGYVGLASACREMLIRNSVLSSDTLTTSQHIPFMLTVIGAQSGKSSSSYTKLSTYEQTLDLLNLMKAKSINNIDIRYSGMLDGADTQDILSKAEPIGSLGSRKDFEKLSQYVSTQKFEMYLDISLTSFNKKSASVSKNAASNLTGEDLAFNSYSEYKDMSEDSSINASSKSYSKMYALALSKLENNVLSFLNNTNAYSVDGYCINDAGRMLYSDYADEAHNRSNAVNILSTQVSTLANNHKIMVENGNFYMLKNADAVIDLPSDTTYPETESYVSIPFVQMVLHGITDYAMEPVNLSDNPQKAFLKSVEYGAMPSYEWICTKTDDETLNNKFYYENQLADAAEKYIKSDAAIGDLRNARMTSHSQLQEGVFCTEYNNSIILYFNYNDTAVTVNSVTVEPMSFLRVN